jgi:hypothetical protein
MLLSVVVRGRGRYAHTARRRGAEPLTERRSDTPWLRSRASPRQPNTGTLRHRRGRRPSRPSVARQDRPWRPAVRDCGQADTAGAAARAHPLSETGGLLARIGSSPARRQKPRTPRIANGSGRPAARALTEGRTLQAPKQLRQRRPQRCRFSVEQQRWRSGSVDHAGSQRRDLPGAQPATRFRAAADPNDDPGKWPFSGGDARHARSLQLSNP